MAIQSTALSVIINRMKRWQAISRAEDNALVRDLDEALRTNRREIQLPWTLQKGTLKVFNGVLEYPIPDDYDELAYLDVSNQDLGYGDRARFRFTSLKEFYEDPDYRNDIAEIRDGNNTFLGVRHIDSDVIAVQLNGAEDIDDWTVSGDAISATLETVVVKQGNNAIRVAITSSSGTATINNTFTATTQARYKQMYHFKWIYLDAVPTSITMRLKVDASNYLETSGITTQFSGQPLKADAWNLVAHDLNSATETGTISTSSSWAQEDIVLVGASTGTYYVDASYLRQWTSMDFWYYSKYNIILVGATTAGQEYFMDSDEVYSTDSKLVGDSEWIDCIMYDAMMKALADLKETETLNFVATERREAWEKLLITYPSLRPLITTTKYRFQSDLN